MIQTTPSCASSIHKVSGTLCPVVQRLLRSALEVLRRPGESTTLCLNKPYELEKGCPSNVHMVLCFLPTTYVICLFQFIYGLLLFWRSPLLTLSALSTCISSWPWFLLWLLRLLSSHRMVVAAALGAAPSMVRVPSCKPASQLVLKSCKSWTTQRLPIVLESWNFVIVVLLVQCFHRHRLLNCPHPINYPNSSSSVTSESSTHF